MTAQKAKTRRARTTSSATCVLGRTGREPIYHDVDGAPFKVGERVRVVGSQDETFDPRYRGLVGTVRYFEYKCGCGQSYPNDPMIGVRFRGARTEEFWKEELLHLYS